MSGNQRKRLAEDVEHELAIDGNEDISAERYGSCDTIDDIEIDYNVQNMEVTHHEEIHTRNENINNNDEVVDMNDINDDLINDVNDNNDDDNDDDSISSDDNYDDNLGDCRLQLAMLNTGKSINTILKLIKLFPMELRHKNKLGDNPLHTACEHCHEDVVMHIIELYPDAARHKNKSGSYPLNISLITDKRCHGKFTVDGVMRLIEAFPDAALKGTHIWGTALLLACRDYRSEAITAKLIEINPLAIQKRQYDYYPIHIALFNKQPIGVIKLLLDGDPLGMERRSHEMYHNNPFHLACEISEDNVVKYLMQRSDLQINVRNQYGMTPLFVACRSLRYKNVEILLNHPDIHVNALNFLHQTPLHVTATSYNQNPEHAVHIIKMLLDHPFICMNQKNYSNKTTLDLMKETPVIQHITNDNLQCYNEIVNLLEEFSIKQRWLSYCYHVKEFTPNF